VGNAHAASVQGIRYSINAERTRIVLDTNGRCSYDVSEHRNPARIAINLRGTGAGKALRNVRVDKGSVERVRVNRLSWGTQVVIDLGASVQWEHFRLARSGSHPNRIVIDLTPVRSLEVAGMSPSSPATGPIIVAVDPGHGGKDPGAVGRYNLVEKKMVLDIARRVARDINEVPGFKAVLTRNSDVYLTLPRRTAIARSKGADVFVSIHLNTAKNRSARGTEIYFVSPAGAASSASKVLANPERAASKYGLGDANSDLLHMLVDMNESAVLAQSESLGESILKAMNRPGLLPTRTVKQKSFSVLRTIEMPSVLVEVGFISNNSDAKFIRREAGRDAIADAISDGVVKFLRANPPLRADGDRMIVHRVRRGDTLWKISQKYNTSVASLRKTNKLSRSSVLRVGQELVVSEGY